MSADSAASPFETPLALGKRSGVLAIRVGGLIAGSLDLTQACILFGRDESRGLVRSSAAGRKRMLYRVRELGRSDSWPRAMMGSTRTAWRAGM